MNKYLKTGSKGNSEFCFPETFNIEGGEKTKLIVSREASHQEICYNSQLKTRANCEKNKYLLDAGWHMPVDLGCTT